MGKRASAAPISLACLLRVPEAVYRDFGIKTSRRVLILKKKRLVGCCFKEPGTLFFKSSQNIDLMELELYNNSWRVNGFVATIYISSFVDCEQSLSFPHNQSNLELRAAKLQAKTGSKLLTDCIVGGGRRTNTTKYSQIPPTVQPFSSFWTVFGRSFIYGTWWWSIHIITWYMIDSNVIISMLHHHVSYMKDLPCNLCEYSCSTW